MDWKKKKSYPADRIAVASLTDPVATELRELDNRQTLLIGSAALLHIQEANWRKDSTVDSFAGEEMCKNSRGQVIYPGNSLSLEFCFIPKAANVFLKFQMLQETYSNSLVMISHLIQTRSNNFYLNNR